MIYCFLQEQANDYYIKKMQRFFSKGFFSNKFSKTVKRTFSEFQKKVELPKLAYNYEDLEPVLSRDLVETHHSKHHQAYVTNYNKQIDELKVATEKQDLEKIVYLTPHLKFNGGSHINHSIYWTNLAPIKNGGGVIPDQNSKLRKHIEQTWGSIDSFINMFNANTLAIQGSGWGWLVYDKNTKTLQYKDMPNQDPICLYPNLVPILTIDIWEHAFYITYKNRKPDYMKEIWKIINWRNLEERYNNGL